MRRLPVLTLAVTLLCSSGYLVAQAQIRQQGRATVEFRSPTVNAAAAYDYSQRNHAGAWLLIELAVQSTARIAFHRDQLFLRTPDERNIPVATQEEFLEAHQELTRLLQNASVWRRSLDAYFLTRPQRTIRFFAPPGGIVHDSAVSNLDEVASGDLFFKSPDGRWPAGTYRLTLNHEQARVEIPIVLE